MSDLVYKASDFDDDTIFVWAKKRTPPGFARQPSPHLSIQAPQVWLTPGQVRSLITALQVWLDRQEGGA